eukprot:scaffold1149_cov173-Skeletonema_marinoi.AAC.9
MPTNTNITDVAIDIDLSAIAAAADPAEEEDIEAIDGARARQGRFMWKVRLDLKWGYRCSIVYSCVVTGEKEFRVVGKLLVIFTLSI